MSTSFLRPYRIQTRMVMSIILLALAALLVSLLIFTQSARSARRDLDSSNHALLRQSMNQIEEMLVKTERLSTSFVLDSAYFGSFMSGREHSAYEKYRLQKEFDGHYSSLNTLYPDTVSMYIYSITSGDLFVNGALFTREEFGDEKWLSEVFIAPQKGRWQGGLSIDQFLGYQRFARKPVVQLARNYPLGATEGAKGIFTIVINADALAAVLARALPAQAASAWIVTPENTLVAAAGNRSSDLGDPLALYSQYAERGTPGQPFKWQGKTYLISTVTSPYTRWRYILCVPETSMTQLISAVGYTFIVAVLGFFLVVLLLWSVMLTGISRPLKKLVTQVGATLGGDTPHIKRNELAYLGDAFHTLLSQREDLEAMIRGFRPDMRNLLVTDLTRVGRVTDFERHMASVRMVGLEIYPDAFCVALVRGHVAKIDALEAALRAHLNRDGQTVGVALARREEGDYLLLFSASAQLQVAPLERAMLRAAKDAHIAEPAIGIGRVYTDYLGIPLSYREADSAQKHCLLLGAELLSYEALPSDRPEELLEIQDELSAVVHSLRSAERSDLDRALAALYDCMHERAFTTAMALAASHELLLRGIRAAEEADVDLAALISQYPEGLLSTLGNCTALSEMQDLQIRVFSFLRECIAARMRTIGSARLTNKAVRYIDDNYTDANLNANSVAAAFHVTASHMSRAFKANTGMNLSDYLTQLRVERAKHLLKTTQLTIADIAANVGYLNQQTFIRAYKKTTGVPPGSWRKSTSDEGDELSLED